MAKHTMSSKYAIHSKFSKNDSARLVLICTSFCVICGKVGLFAVPEQQRSFFVVWLVVSIASDFQINLHYIPWVIQFRVL